MSDDQFNRLIHRALVALAVGLLVVALTTLVLIFAIGPDGFDTTVTVTECRQ